MFKLKQKILYIFISIIYYLNKTLHMKIVNSSLWYNIYYKHTTKCKKELKQTSKQTKSILKQIRKKKK